MALSYSPTVFHAAGVPREEVGRGSERNVSAGLALSYYERVLHVCCSSKPLCPVLPSLSEC